MRFHLCQRAAMLLPVSVPFIAGCQGKIMAAVIKALIFASTAVMAQAKANQSSWETRLSLPGFPSADIIAYTNPSLPFPAFFHLLWQFQVPPPLFPKLLQLSLHLSLCLYLILHAPSLSSFYLPLIAAKWLY